jgi:hypothetical protein
VTIAGTSTPITVYTSTAGKTVYTEECYESSTVVTACYDKTTTVYTVRPTVTPAPKPASEDCVTIAGTTTYSKGETVCWDSTTGKVMFCVDFV